MVSTTDIPILQIRKLRQRVVMRLSRIAQVVRDTQVVRVTRPARRESVLLMTV